MPASFEGRPHDKGHVVLTAYQNVALAAATQWLFNFVVARAVPNMLATVGDHGYGTYLIFGSFCVSMFFFVWFFIPETKGMSIPHPLNSQPLPFTPVH